MSLIEESLSSGLAGRELYFSVALALSGDISLVSCLAECFGALVVGLAGICLGCSALAVALVAGVAFFVGSVGLG